MDHSLNYTPFLLALVQLFTRIVLIIPFYSWSGFDDGKG